MGIYNSHGSPNGSPKKNCGRPSVSDYSQWMFVSWIVSLIISLPLFLFRILHGTHVWIYVLVISCYFGPAGGMGMAPHSSTLAWKIPWMEKPGRLQSMRSLRVGHDWATSLSLFTFMNWRRKWQPTPVFLPGESQRRGSLVGCRLWGRTESDTTEVT